MRGMGFRTMRNSQHIPDPLSNFAWGHPKLFGVIRGNSAADEQIFAKFGVCMDNGTQKAAL